MWHHSRLCAVLIDCRTASLEDARFWVRRLVAPLIPTIRAAVAITSCWKPRPMSSSCRFERVDRGAAPSTLTLRPTIFLPKWHARRNVELPGCEPPRRTFGSDGGADGPTLLRGQSAAPRFSEERPPLGLGTGCEGRIDRFMLQGGSPGIAADRRLTLHLPVHRRSLHGACLPRH